MLIHVLSSSPEAVHTKGVNWTSISLILGIVSTCSIMLGAGMRVMIKSLGRFVHDEVTTVTDVLDKNISGLDQRQKMMLIGALALVGVGVIEKVARLAEQRRTR